MENFRNTSHVVTTCFHCGDIVRGERVEHDGKTFCCSGCKVVYEILEQNNLCQYYSLEKAPGIQPNTIESSRFDYLEDESVQKQLLNFSDGKRGVVTLLLPSIHCSSCIWLLEHLYRLDAGITSSQVDFLKKQISVSFDQTKTSLKNIVVLLSSIGYEPELRHDAGEKKYESETTRTLYYKIGIAGFCFGNSMLFSFPEYLGVDTGEPLLLKVFSYLNLLLGIPVFFYCSVDYFKSSWSGLKKRIINIDIPIAIGIVLLFGRSAYEILTQTGPGFIDSMCGLLFFLLLGRVFQSKTYDRMNFERNYKSYFPIAVTTKKNGVETTVPISALKKGDRIVIRNNEIIPADAMLLRGNAAIDYSFVTGEATPVEKVLGEMIYAGGRQIGGSIELEAMKEVSQSYLTQLWNKFDEAKKEKGELSELSNTVSKYFTYVVLTLATAVGAYWLQYDVKTAINAFTGILIVACPCALAISIPFTLGTALRIFGRKHFYLKNTAVIEALSKIDTIVFDKTGTITHSQRSSVEFVGIENKESMSCLRKPARPAGGQASSEMDSGFPPKDEAWRTGRRNDNRESVEKCLSEIEIQAVYSVAKNSIHPLSKIISEWLSGESLHPNSTDVILTPHEVRGKNPEEIKEWILRHPDSVGIPQNDNDLKVTNAQLQPVENYSEIVGSGISGVVDGIQIKLGSREFTGSVKASHSAMNESRVYLSIDGNERGYFSIKNVYRDELESVINDLKSNYDFAVLSGDNESERVRLQSFFPSHTELRFNQLPSDKLDVVKHLQKSGKKVLMVGDGLNDAGALMQSSVGIAVTEDVAQFSPASDAILAGEAFVLLPTILRFSKRSIKVVILSFVFAFLYNLVGLYFAVQGALSPILAAILMPASSITIVVLSTGVTQLFARRERLLS